MTTDVNAERSLRARGFSGALWMFATHSIVLISQLAIVVALTRQLSERELGLVTLSIALMNLALLFGGFGLARGLVRMQVPQPAYEASAFVGCLVAGGIASLTCLAAAPAIARFFEAPELHGPLAVGGAAFLIVAAFQVPQAGLERAMRFRTIGLAQTFGFALPAALITVVAARLGAGVWCAVWGTLIGRSLQGLWLVAAAGERPRPSLAEAGATRELARFGLQMTGATVLGFAVANIDYAFVGKLLGPAALGVYTIAYQLATVPRSRIGQALAAVTFPAFSKLQNDPARFNRSYITLNRYVAYIVFPALAALFALAEPIVTVAFGERWLPAVAVLRVLCPAGALMAVRSTAGPALSAIGRPDLGAYTNAVIFVVSMPTLAVLAPLGLTHAAFAVLLISILDFLPLQLVLHRLTGLSLRRFATALVAPSALALTLGAGLWLALSITPTAAGATVRLASGTLAAAGLYAALLVLFGRAFMREMAGLAAASWSGR